MICYCNIKNTFSKLSRTLQIRCAPTSSEERSSFWMWLTYCVEFSYISTVLLFLYIFVVSVDKCNCFAPIL